MPRIGILIPAAPPPAPQPWPDALSEGLRGLGYVIGQTVHLEVRWASTEAVGRHAEPVLSLVRLPVDLIVVPITSAAIVAKRATTIIPIVAAAGGALVEGGVIT